MARPVTRARFDTEDAIFQAFESEVENAVARATRRAVIRLGRLDVRRARQRVPPEPPADAPAR